jgi:hypothetical protein
MLNTLYRLNLYPSEKASKLALAEFKKSGQPMGPRDRVSVSLSELSDKICKEAGLVRYLKRVQETLDDFLPKKIKEESERKTLLSEVLLGSRRRKE